MTGPWEQLRTTRALDAATVDLVYETVDAVRRFDRYPPPAGNDRWTEDAIQEFAHDFLYGPNGPERLTRLVASATSEDSFERVLEAAVRNEFRMQARSTDKGAVLRALTHAVERDDNILILGTTTTTRTWTLDRHADEAPFAGRINDLIDAAYAVPDVRRARWSPTSTRRPPIAESDSLRRVIHGILGRAQAPVDPQTMLQVIVARFPNTVTGTVEVDSNHVAAVSRTGDAVTIAQFAWEELSDNERLVSGILDLSIREIAEATGLSRSTAQRAVAGARTALAEILVDMDGQESVVAELAEMSAAVRNIGTERVASASDTTEED